jgi:hypothetical protein
MPKNYDKTAMSGSMGYSKKGKSERYGTTKSSVPSLVDGDQEKPVYGLDSTAAKDDLGRLEKQPVGNMGYDKKAFDYDF